MNTHPTEQQAEVETIAYLISWAAVEAREIAAASVTDDEAPTRRAVYDVLAMIGRTSPRSAGLIDQSLDMLTPAYNGVAL